MIARPWTAVAAVGCIAGAAALAPPTLQSIQQPAYWLLRPAALPFAWRSLEEASRAGDANEAFARAQQILHLLPGWTDAQVVFAYRFAVDGGAGLSDVGRAEAAHTRLQIALAWLESARQTAGRREVELLQSMALLPEIATRQIDGLEARLQQAGSSAAAYADRYLAAAEAISQSAAVREQRTYLTPVVAAGLLAIGDRAGAIAALETGIARAADLRDPALATEWAERLREVIRFLRGQDVNLDKVRADPRMAPLLPYLD